MRLPPVFVVLALIGTFLGAQARGQSIPYCEFEGGIQTVVVYPCGTCGPPEDEETAYCTETTCTRCDGTGPAGCHSNAQLAALGGGWSYPGPGGLCGGTPEGVSINSCKPKCVPHDCASEERSGGDPAAAACNVVGDPVDLTTLFLNQTATDVDLGGGLRFTRHYSSGWLETPAPGPLGHKWDHALHWRAQRRITPAGHRILVVRHPLILPQVFAAGGTTPLQANATSGTLTGIATDTPVYVSGDGVRVAFELDPTPNPPDGETTWFRATSIQHPGEPAISVSYPPPGNQVVLSNGTTSMEFLLADGRIDHVVTPLGTWDYDYEDDRLERVTGPHLSTPDPDDEVVLTYEYLVGGAPYHLLTKVKRKVGTAPEETLATWTYFAGSRWVKTADEPGLDQPLTFAVSGTSPLTTEVKDPSSTILATFVSKEGRIQSVTGEGGPGVEVPFATATYVETPNPQGDPVQTNWKTTTDPEGNKTLYEDYDSRAHAGRVVEGWEDTDSSGDWSTGDGGVRIDRTWHPTLDTPLTETRPSTLPSAPDSVVTFNYDDPTVTGHLITERLYEVIRSGSTLNEAGQVVQDTATTTFTYNVAGDVETISGPRSPENFTRHVYDPVTGYRTATRRHLNGPTSVYLETTFSNFDSRGNPQTVIDPNGAVTTFTYDGAGRIRTVTPPWTGPGSSTATFTYDADGRLDLVQFPDDSDGNEYQLDIGWDVKGNPLYVVDSNGDALVYEYAKGRRTREARYRGFEAYSPEEARGALAGDAGFSYDAAGRLFKAFNPLFTDPSVFTQFSYDEPNEISVTDENGKADTLLFDALDRLEKLSQVRGGTTYETVLDYDSLSNVTKVTDPAGLATDYKSDDFGRLIEVISPDTGTTRFVYDDAGNLITRIENVGPSQRIIRYEYDGLDRLAGVDFPNDPDWLLVWDTDVSKFQKGRLDKVMIAGVPRTTFEYTPRGEVASERTASGSVVSLVTYTWDAAGNLASVTTPTGGKVTYHYSGARPSKVTVEAGGLAETIRDIKWLPFGPRTEADFPPYNGSANVVESERGHNLRGQVEAITVTAPSGPEGGVLNRTYVYDSAIDPLDKGPNLDRITDLRDAPESRTYRYDPLDRLSAVENPTGTPLEGFVYSPGGNRTSWTDASGTTTYGHTTGTNRLVSATGARARHYENDAYGNRIYEGTAPYVGTATHVYDDANRLIEVRDPGAGFAVVATYAYDSFGRRIKKTVGGVSTFFVYDLAGHLLSERRYGQPDTVRDYVWLEDELVGVVDATVTGGGCAGVPALLPRDLLESAWWVTGGAAFLLVLLTPRLRRRPRWAATVVGLAALAGSVAPARSAITNVKLYWVHVDHLGTPLAMTDNPATPSAAKTVWRASYSAYGKATVNDDPDGDGQTVSLRVRFPGQYEDVETGLHYNWHRGYDPFTGRYLQPDPIGQQSSPNLFMYSLGNPANFVDPTGLDPLTLALAYTSSLYRYAHDTRLWGHTNYPGETNSPMRHCVVSCLVASKYGRWGALGTGVGNELQGLAIHDVPSVAHALTRTGSPEVQRRGWGRLSGTIPWAFQFQDFANNERGFDCADDLICKGLQSLEAACIACCAGDPQ